MMRSKEIEKIIYRKPFAPFRVMLDDGEEIVVHKSRRALLSGPEMAVVGLSRRNGGPDVERLRIVPVQKVVSLEVLSDKA